MEVSPQKFRGGKNNSSNWNKCEFSVNGGEIDEWNQRFRLGQRNFSRVLEWLSGSGLAPLAMLYTLSWSSNYLFLALYYVNYLKYQSSWAFTFWSHSSHACQAAKPVVHILCHLLQSSLDSGNLWLSSGDINFSRPSAFSAWSLQKVKENFQESWFLRIRTCTVWWPLQKKKRKYRSRKCWRNHHGHNLKILT